MKGSLARKLNEINEVAFKQPTRSSSNKKYQGSPNAENIASLELSLQALADHMFYLPGAVRHLGTSNTANGLIKQIKAIGNMETALRNFQKAMADYQHAG